MKGDKKTMFKRIKGFVKGVAVAVGVVAVPAIAKADVVLTGVTLDTATPELLAATVLAGLGVIWGIRKLVKLVNRS